MTPQQPKTLAAEIRAVLTAHPDGLTTTELFDKCTLAEERKQIAARLHGLREHGYVEKPDDGRWRITGKQRPAGSPGTKKSATAEPPAAPPPTKPSAPAPAAPAPLPGSTRPAAPRADSTMDLLTRSANSARQALEAYLEACKDPVLEHLLAAAGEAEQALSAYRAAGAHG